MKSNSEESKHVNKNYDSSKYERLHLKAIAQQQSKQTELSKSNSSNVKVPPTAPKRKLPSAPPEKHVVGDIVYSNKNYKISSIPESVLNKINQPHPQPKSISPPISIPVSNSSKENASKKLKTNSENISSSSGIKMNSNYSILKFNKIEKEINDPEFQFNKKMKLNHIREILNNNDGKQEIQQQQKEEEPIVEYSNFNLPFILQKEVILILLEYYGSKFFPTLRRVCRYWKRVCHQSLPRLSIYFTDFHLLSSVTTLSERFYHSVNNDFQSLENISFINKNKSVIAYGPFYLNTIIHPFIKNIIMSNRNLKSIEIKSFPINHQNFSKGYDLDKSSSPMTESQDHSNIVNTSPCGNETWQCLSISQNFTNISLVGIGLEKSLWEPFFKDLSKNKVLESMRISDNIGIIGLNSLVSVWCDKKGSMTSEEDTQEKPFPQLRKLNLTKNKLSGTSGDSLNKLFLSPNVKIEVLDISRNRVGDGIYNIQNGFKRNSHLKQFIARENRLSLVSDIDFGPSITLLDLSDNIFNQGNNIKGLMYSLRNCNIESLNLTRCHIDNASITLLSSNLEFNYSLKTIDLSFNFFSQAAIDPFFDSIVHSKIESLCIQGNNLNSLVSQSLIGMGGFKTLMKSVSGFNKSLLEFTNNNSSSTITVDNYSKIKVKKKKKKEKEKKKGKDKVKKKEKESRKDKKSKSKKNRDKQKEEDEDEEIKGEEEKETKKEVKEEIVKQEFRDLSDKPNITLDLSFNSINIKEPNEILKNYSSKLNCDIYNLIVFKIKS
ncbi:hypothetical protein CYY_003270 [Polysphondylium violaceum]|uniref:F-box domain-containing protein n=1 Tax=Polysphondylium violaceum TaxID=133409 RepID=A0A8J4PXA3_9MYCE|nr:hypothetical protein CYY_003270 [Polysphondylium violaceum]